MAVVEPDLKYSDAQVRDDHGRWAAAANAGSGETVDGAAFTMEIQESLDGLLSQAAEQSREDWVYHATWPRQYLKEAAADEAYQQALQSNLRRMGAGDTVKVYRGERIDRPSAVSGRAFSNVTMWRSLAENFVNAHLVSDEQGNLTQLSPNLWKVTGYNVPLPDVIGFGAAQEGELFVRSGALKSIKGGAGSGDHGHAGRPGEVGGSGQGSGLFLEAWNLGDNPIWGASLSKVAQAIDKVAAGGTPESALEHSAAAFIADFSRDAIPYGDYPLYRQTVMPKKDIAGISVGDVLHFNALSTTIAPNIADHFGQDAMRKNPTGELVKIRLPEETLSVEGGGMFDEGERITRGSFKVTGKWGPEPGGPKKVWQLELEQISTKAAHDVTDEARDDHGRWTNLTGEDYAGKYGNLSHITRNERGTIATYAIAKLQGVMGEVPGAHRLRQGAEWDSFLNSIQKNGITSPIFITVDPGKDPKISEGNHRRDAAVELGLPSVPVEIRYFGHAEQEGTVAERGAKSIKGGPGSGDHNHSGRHGEVGGSSASEGKPIAQFASDLTHAPALHRPADVGAEVLRQANEDPAVQAVAAALAQHGDLQVVGGAVRDIAMGKAPKDFDLRIHGVPEGDLLASLQAIPDANVIRTGDNFPVFRVKTGGSEVEVAMPRTEDPNNDQHYLSDHTITPEQDSQRRDFTANSVGVSLTTGEVHDPFHGLEDIKNNILNTVTPESFVGDPNRMLRALVRISDGVNPSTDMLHQMAENAPRMATIPAERIQGDFQKMMANADPVRGLDVMEKTGLLDHVIPELRATVGYDQNNPYHDQELWDHIVSVVGRVAELNPDPDVRTAALLHDIGKPETRTTDELGVGHYYSHEKAGAEMANEILTRLKYPTDSVDRITHLVDNHMFSGTDWTLRSATRFASKMNEGLDGLQPEQRDRVAQQRMKDLMDIREADQYNHAVPNDGNTARNRELLRQVGENQIPTNRYQIAFNGTDLIDMGLTPGPQFRDILDHLQTRVQDGLPNDAQTLQDAVRLFIKKHGIVIDTKGGPGSGNYGHSGRQGEVGGSAATHVTWHLTDNPHFTLDPKQIPQDNSTLGMKEDAGLFVSQNPESWINGHDYVRPYIAELHASPQHYNDAGAYPSEHFIPAQNFDKVTVARVIPLDAYAREEYGEYGWIESHHGTTFDTGEPIPESGFTGPPSPLRGYHYQGPDVRDMAPEELDRHKQRWLDYLRDNRGFPQDRLAELADSKGDMTPREVKGGPGSGNHGHTGRPGQVGGSSSGTHDWQTVPKAPGETPIPEGTVRLYHYTNDGPEALESIRKNGILQSHARGESYREPSVVWASGQQPGDFKHFVEFYADPRKDLDIGQFADYYKNPDGTPFTLHDWVEGHRDVTMKGDVPADHIIAVHEPWHHTFRYMEADAEHFKQEMVETPGFYSKEAWPAGSDEQRAFAAFKDKHGIKGLVDIDAKGSALSGNHGHAGRPGQVGGSAPLDPGPPAPGTERLYHGTTQAAVAAARLKGSYSPIDPREVANKIEAELGLAHDSIVNDRNYYPMKYRVIERGETPSDPGVYLTANHEFARYYSQLGSETVHDALGVAADLLNIPRAEQNKWIADYKAAHGHEGVVLHIDLPHSEFPTRQEMMSGASRATTPQQIMESMASGGAEVKVPYLLAEHVRAVEIPDPNKEIDLLSHRTIYGKWLALRATKGSALSGNHGHAGRPGQVGGSGSGGTRPWHPTIGPHGDPNDYDNLVAMQGLYVQSAATISMREVAGTNIVDASDALRGAVKSGIATVLGPESGLGYQRASDLLATWAASSSDTKPDSIALQAVAAEKFGIQSPYLDRQVKMMELLQGFSAETAPADGPIERMRIAGMNITDPGGISASVLTLRDQSFEGRKDDAGKFLDSMYKVTQATLAQAGIEEVTVFRGMQFTDATVSEPPALAALPMGSAIADEGLHDVTMTANPLSAFSLDPDIALRFSGTGSHAYMLAVTVPASRVVSLATTGIGCLNEQEVVVSGGPIHTGVARMLNQNFVNSALGYGNFPQISDIGLDGKPVPLGLPPSHLYVPEEWTDHEIAMGFDN